MNFRSYLYRIKKKYFLYGNIYLIIVLIHKFRRLAILSNEKHGLTVIITSCGRKKYLDKTLMSLKKYLVTDIPIKWFIIDDYPNSFITRNYILTQDFDLRILNMRNKGLGYSLNKVYSRVRTKYILHCEDDWEFLEKIPLHRMIEILENDNSIGQVLLNRVQPYKVKAERVVADYAIYNKTYSFNPHLTTYAKALTCLPFPLIQTERKITDKMRELNIKSAILGYEKKNYVNHIGVEKYANKY